MFRIEQVDGGSKIAVRFFILYSVFAQDADITCRYLSVRRSDYQQVLHEAALEAGSELRLGQKVIGIEEALPGVQLQDGATVHGDIVIIADGIYASLFFFNPDH